MTNINRLPAGTTLEKYNSVGWVGIVEPLDGVSEEIGPIRNPDLGTVVEHLLILVRRRKQGGLTNENN